MKTEMFIILLERLPTMTGNLDKKPDLSNGSSVNKLKKFQVNQLKHLGGQNTKFYLEVQIQIV